MDQTAKQITERGRGASAERRNEGRTKEENDGEAEVEVNLVTDAEAVEPDVGQIGNSERPDGFDGFETSVQDHQVEDSGPRRPEKGSFAPSPEYAE